MITGSFWKDATHAQQLVGTLRRNRLHHYVTTKSTAPHDRAARTNGMGIFNGPILLALLV
jgi:hypothetical protein